MTSLQSIQALIEAAEKATPGEWYCYPDTLAGSVWVSAKGSPLLEPLHYLKEHLFRVRKDSQQEWMPGETASARDDRFWKQKQADAEFIALARNSIEALKLLLARLEAAEDIVERVEAKFPEKKLRAIVHGYRLQFPKLSPLPSAPETTEEGRAELGYKK